MPLLFLPGWSRCVGNLRRGHRRPGAGSRASCRLRSARPSASPCRLQQSWNVSRGNGVSLAVGLILVQLPVWIVAFDAVSNIMFAIGFARSAPLAHAVHRLGGPESRTGDAAGGRPGRRLSPAWSASAPDAMTVACENLRTENTGDGRRRRGGRRVAGRLQFLWPLAALRRSRDGQAARALACRRACARSVCWSTTPTRASPRFSAGCDLDLLQLHGHETPERAAEIRAQASASR